MHTNANLDFKATFLIEKLQKIAVNLLETISCPFIIKDMCEDNLYNGGQVIDQFSRYNLDCLLKNKQMAAVVEMFWNGPYEVGSFL